MRKKKDNNLIMITVNGEKHYFTSMTRASYLINLPTASIKYALENGIVDKVGENGEKITISIVDGSDIKYKFINN